MATNQHARHARQATGDPGSPASWRGVAALDNLGLPESGDGKGDILQEVKYEADFLAKMQDKDGGFYFLVYPRGREYENDVPPSSTPLMP